MSKDSVQQIAKKKLKSHIIKNGHRKVIPTESLALYWWRVINKALFDNQLENPREIVIRKLRGSWGYCEGKKEDDVIITLSDSINTRKLFIAIVFHEMVHQWQWVTNKKLDHGGNFNLWKNYFERIYKIDSI